MQVIGLEHFIPTTHMPTPKKAWREVRGSGLGIYKVNGTAARPTQAATHDKPMRDTVP